MTNNEKEIATKTPADKERFHASGGGNKPTAKSEK